MNNIRIIPSLLIKNKKLVKTIRFQNPRYIGDPINAIKIFNNFIVDEIILQDIGISENKLLLDFEYLQKLTSECFIPICYGGGVTSVEIASKLFAIGIEKISINTAAVENLQLIKTLSKNFGSQSIIGTLDCKKTLTGRYKIKIHNKKNTKYSPVDFAQELEANGAGELLINSINQDGVMTGYDLELLSKISQKVNVPIIASGGAGNLNHMKMVFDRTGINAFAAGSLFVYSGKLNAVLINYPSREDVNKIFSTTI